MYGLILASNALHTYILESSVNTAETLSSLTNAAQNVVFLILVFNHGK